MPQIVTPENAYKLSELTTAQRDFVRTGFGLGDYVREFSSVKTSTNHAINIPVLTNGYTYLFTNDKIINLSDTFSDIAANSFNVLIKEYEYLPPNWPCQITIEGTDAIISRYTHYDDIKGHFLGKFGVFGSGDGQFNSPRGVTVSGSFIYIVDNGNNRVQKFDLNGNFVAKWGTSGSGDGQFNNPQGIAINNSSVFVADTSNSRVQIFDLEGNFINKFGSGGATDGMFNNALKITINKKTVFVVDLTNNRIQKFI